MILHIKLWTTRWGGGGGGVVITACKCCEWCDLLWCENVKIKVLTLNFLSCCVKGWYRPYVVMQYGCMNEWRILVYLFAFILYFPMTKWRSFILFKIKYLLLLLIIINYYLLLKTLEITNSSCKLNQKNISRALPITSRPSNGERPVIGGFIFVLRRSTGPPAVTWRWPDDDRRGIGRKFWPFGKKIGRRPNSLPAVIVMWPLDGLRHCSRSRKSADELPISKNRHPAKIERPPRGFMFLGTSA